MPDPAARRPATASRTPTCSRAAAAFRRARRAMQDDEIARLGAELALEQWHLPQLPVAGLGPADVADLAASIRPGAAR